jgi:cyclase
MSASQLRLVAPGIHAWIGAGGDSNAGAIETPHGLVVIDAQQSQALGETFRRSLEGAAGMPIRLLVNTHGHLDHVAGNIAFSDVPIVAHEAAMLTLERELGPLGPGSVSIADTAAKVRLFFGSNFDELVPEIEQEWFRQRVGNAAPLVIAPPSQTFADRLDFMRSDGRVKVDYWGPSHSAGDLVIYHVEQGVLFLGDLFFNGRFPWFGDCDLNGWIASLDRALALDARVVIPGHGEPTSLRELAEFRDLLTAVRTSVEQKLAEGASEDAAVASIILPKYAAMPRYKEWMPFNIRSAYRFLSGASRA